MSRILVEIVFTTLVIFVMVACSTDQVAKIQGHYEINKDSLRAGLTSEIDDNNAFAIGLLNTVIENSLIELDIKGDSVKGIIFLAGEAALVDSPVHLRNDSLVISIGDSEAFLFATQAGISYQAGKSNMKMQLTRTEGKGLSQKALDAIETRKSALREKEEFERNLGIWQQGYYVDEFGDRTGGGYLYSINTGTHDNSISVNKDIYVKASIEGESLYFQIYNTSFSMKESLPDSKFGSMKLKFPDGSVKTERVFFYNNSISESPYDNINILHDYITKHDGVVKVLIDLSTANSYYSDKYQFNLSKSNLEAVLQVLK